MKKFKHFTSLLCIAIVLLIGCEKEPLHEEQVLEKTNLESVKRENNITTIKHHYDYYGEQFTVVYHFDNESQEVLNVEGDTEQASSLFSTEDTRPKGILIEDLEEYDENTAPIVPEFVEINLRLFNTAEEMDVYINENYGEIPSSEGKVSRELCVSSQLIGVGSFRFYKHAYYNTEMLPLRRTGKRVFRNHWVGNNNDQLSSFFAFKPFNHNSYTKLYEHPCYTGTSIGFYKGRLGGAVVGVRNLSWYRLVGWWGNKRNWNDVTSSIKGWTW